jgi:hypothetical protein
MPSISSKKTTEFVPLARGGESKNCEAPVSNIKTPENAAVKNHHKNMNFRFFWTLECQIWSPKLFYVL